MIGEQIAGNFHIGIAGQFVESYMMIVAAMALGYIAHMTPKTWTAGVSQAYMSMAAIWQALLLAVVLFVVVQTRQSDLVPFIYLQY